ncbi:MAG: ABC transporter ATP-binding protein [Clostridia bacterium]|nr:ABC transporter ATP-binding protein [Clostridia bacterium]
MEKKLVLTNGTKKYKLKNETITAMDNVNLEIDMGKLYVIMGHSGSGKSTLIQMLGLLDSLTSGKLYINGDEISNISEDKKAELRKKEIGFVFQSFYLNPKLTALENVMLPMYINEKIKSSDRREIAEKLLEKLGLENRKTHYPKELSGGEQQRIAIARALANNPNYILADEPTGNLDSENEKNVYRILKELTKEGKAVVIVSHNENIKQYADEIFYMEAGKLRKGL